MWESFQRITVVPELWNITELINVFSSFRGTYGQIIPTLGRGVWSEQEKSTFITQVYSEKQLEHKWVYIPHRVTLWTQLQSCVQIAQYIPSKYQTLHAGYLVK